MAGACWTQDELEALMNAMLYRTIRHITIPFDLVVATEDDLARYGDTVGYVYREALEEGRELYAA